jgi:hypothetical protein
MTEVVHPPVISEIESRNGSLAYDSFNMNVIIDKDSNGIIARKRPGFNFTQTNGAIAQGIHQGSIYRYDIRGDTLYVINPNGTTFATQSLAFSSSMYSFADSGNLVATPFTSFHGISNAVVYKWVSDNTFSYTTVSGAVGSLVPGYAQLDGTFYVMDSSGNIWGSDILDVGSWDPLNKIVMPLEDGVARGICRHYDHILAFGSTTMAVFVDAGNATGSPLQQATNYFRRIGCFSGLSIAQVNDEVSWISQTDTGYIRVMRMTGLDSKEISTPAICKILNRSGNTVNGISYCINLSDRYLYCVQVTTNTSDTITLAFDSRYNVWYSWQFSTTTNGLGQNIPTAVFTQSTVDSCTYTTPFTNSLDVNVYSFISMSPVGDTLQYLPIHSLSNNQITIRMPFNTQPATFIANVNIFSSLSSPVVTAWSRGVVQISDSSLMTINTTNADQYVNGATTVTNPIVFRTRSPESDFGSLDLKSLQCVDLLADMSNGGVYFRESTNDYQTYLPFRYSNLQSRVRLTDLGSFQRVAFDVWTLDNFPFRLRRIDARVEVNG